MVPGPRLVKNEKKTWWQRRGPLTQTVIIALIIVVVIGLYSYVEGNQAASEAKNSGVSHEERMNITSIPAGQTLNPCPDFADKIIYIAGTPPTFSGCLYINYSSFITLDNLVVLIGNSTDEHVVSIYLPFNKTVSLDDKEIHVQGLYIFAFYSNRTELVNELKPYSQSICKLYSPGDIFSKTTIPSWLYHSLCK